jgi:hypothetical protein
MKFNVSTTEGTADVEFKFYFTLDSRESTSIGSETIVAAVLLSNSGNESTLSLCTIFDVFPEEQLHGCSIESPWEPINPPSHADPSTRTYCSAREVLMISPK